MNNAHEQYREWRLYQREEKERERKEQLGQCATKIRALNILGKNALRPLTIFVAN